MFDDIRRGLAANLTTLRPAWQISPYLLDNPTPPCVQVAGIVEVEYQSFGPGGSPLFIWLVEASVPRANDWAYQMALDELMDGGSADLKAAIEADPRLTSRLLDDGTVNISQEPACDDLEAVFQTQVRTRLENGMDAQLATWHVRVLT